ncbi:hypothetical protein KM176_20580 [Pseudooceanicola sp. CBS1P-1]|uniref:DUF4870 family protein n=1 Tax=Pseudooceanicola TaxID=1679449 RepID=UPI0019257513|nr:MULTISPECIES: hypothetical protein [Pseudooceanicola]MBT9386278.1 hypothetical protein [Pseudooceanicola endophyticus]
MTDQSLAVERDFMPPKIIYGLYAVGYFVGITYLAGVIFAYISKGKDEVVDTHLRFQIRTFWISLLISILSLITLFIGIGVILYLFLLVWGLTRIISGFLLANEGKPVSGSRYLGILAI